MSDPDVGLDGDHNMVDPHSSNPNHLTSSPNAQNPAMNYQSALDTWHEFYAITGEGAASLVGLLFVGLSLHLRLVISYPDVRSLAGVTFTNFINTVIVALFMVIPENSPTRSGVELLLVGLIAAVISGPRFVVGVASHGRTIGFRRLLLRFGASAIAFLGLAACGLTMIAGDYQDALTALVAINLMVLVISLRNTWDLLVSVGAAEVSVEARVSA
jgi:hypothetical protein